MSRPEPPPNNDERGRLSEHDREIERLLDRLALGEDATPSDPTQESALALQDEIDASLRRSFAIPEIPADLLARLQEEAPKPAATPTRPQPLAEPAPDSEPPKRKQLLPSWAVAAVLLIGVGAWVYQAQQWLFAPSAGSYSEMPVVAMYTQAVDRGFEPDWFCEDEKRFADTFAERQGTGVWLRTLPEGVRMAGLAYLKGLAKNTTMMMAWADERPVLVAVDRVGSIPTYLLDPPQDDSLSVFVEERDGLTFVEVTPFDTPRVIPSLYQRDPPSEPTGRVPGS